MIIIDGHNLIGKIPELKLSDSNCKKRLLELIDKYQKIMDSKIIVVFDGSTFGEYEREDYNEIEVRYPMKNKTADDVILDLINKYKFNNSVCVVSSDNEIIRAAKLYKLANQSSKSFWEEIENTISKQNENTEEFLSPGDVNKWLEYFNK